MVVLPVWKRQHIAKLALKWYEQQDCEIVVVGSEGLESRSLAIGHHYVEAENYPLDAKYDAGFLYCQQFEPDAVTLIGSDDFITEDYFEWAKEQIMLDGCDITGFLDFYIASMPHKRIYYWGGYTRSKLIDEDRTGDSIGAGRVYSKRALDSVGWKPFLTNGEYLDTFQDDERAINNFKTPKCRFINMANIGCRYWALKTNDEINTTKAFFDNYDNLVNVTEFTKRLFENDLGLKIEP